MSFAYLPLFTGDYLRDTRHLSPLRHGVYLLSLMHCWDSKGPMPLDEQECAGICNCRSVEEIDAMRYILSRFFVRMEDGHYNKRMQTEVERSESISAARSEAGRRGFEARAKHLPSKSQSLAKQVHLSPSPSPSLPPTPAQPSPIPGEPPGPPRPAGASGEQAPPEPKKRERKAKEAPQSSEVWASYSQAYVERYGVQPVRNAKVNGQLAQFVQRLGADEAPGVARFYVSHRNGLYVNAKHCTDLLLRDAEKLRTEWVTGQTTYQRDAREEDRIAATGAMWDRIAQKMESKTHE